MLVAWVGIVGSYLGVSLVRAPRTAPDRVRRRRSARSRRIRLRRPVHEHPTHSRRSRVFWVLLGAGCGIWLIGQAVWTYFEVILRQDVPNPFIGDVILFLHPVSMIGALALNPHDQRDDLNIHTGYVDFSLLLVWWIYLYLFIVIPWQFIAPDVHSYGVTYDYLSGIENAVLVSGFAVLIAKTKGPWRQSLHASIRRFGANLRGRLGAHQCGRSITTTTTRAALTTCRWWPRSCGLGRRAS